VKQQYGIKMSEPIVPHTGTEYAAKRGDDPPFLSRFQFSLRSLLVFILFAALVLTSVLMYRRMIVAEQKTEAAEQEMNKLRNAAGYLKIEDKTLLYAIALETYEPLTWRWRVYLPAGRTYSWRIISGNIPPDGVSKEYVGSTNSASTTGVECIVILSFRKNPDNKWLMTMQVQAADSKNRLDLPVPDEIINQVINVKENPAEGQCIGEGKQVSSKLDVPIIFLKKRILEKQPNGSWQSSPNPMPGIMMWLEAVP
jgi:hypothetical protein